MNIKGEKTFKIALVSGLVVAVVLVAMLFKGFNKADPAYDGPSAATGTGPAIPNTSQFPDYKSSGAAAPAGSQPTTSPGSGVPSDLFNGSGFSASLGKHQISVMAKSDAAMSGIGIWLPTSPGNRKFSKVPKETTYTYSTVGYGKSNLAQMVVQGGPNSMVTSCSILVDGRRVAHQTAKGPWGQVFCAV